MESNSFQSQPLLSKLKKIKTFIFDMDGVLTDGTLLILDQNNQDGGNNWYRKMHVKDGYALQLCAKSGYNMAVVSGSSAPAVQSRLEKLSITNVFFKVTNKKEFLTEMFAKNSWKFEEALYMGDDIPDIEAMKLCGVSACPADAVIEVKNISDYISPFKGGEGSVRDIIRMVMKLQEKWDRQNSITST